MPPIANGSQSPQIEAIDDNNAQEVAENPHDLPQTGYYYQNGEQPEMETVKKRRPKSMRKKMTQQLRGNALNVDRRNAPEWNDRFYVTTSVNNGKLHQFFREYFGKKPKEHSSSFRVKYANSTNELPGITDNATRTHTKVKEFKSLPEKAHQNVKKLMSETRMPLKKGQSTAFPTAKKHFKLASGWQSDFVVLHSRANENVYKSKREFFDQPVSYQTGMNTNKTHALKPMEVYHKITPVRSI